MSSGKRSSGRKRSRSQRDEEEEEGPGGRRVGKAPRRKCEFSADDVEEIASNEYLEILSVVSSLAWNQPSMVLSHRTQTCKWDTAIMPQLFYMDNPEIGEEGEGGGEGGGGEEEWREEVKEEGGGGGDSAEYEIQEESLDIITQAPLWTTRGPEVINHFPRSATDTPDYTQLVRPALGFDYPPVMSRHVEMLVRNHWEKWKRVGLIKDGHDPETRAKFHSIVTDAHIYLANLIKAYITRITRIPLKMVKPANMTRRSNADNTKPQALAAVRTAVEDVASQVDIEIKDDFELTLPQEQNPPAASQHMASNEQTASTSSVVSCDHPTSSHDQPTSSHDRPTSSHDRPTLSHDLPDS